MSPLEDPECSICCVDSADLPPATILVECPFCAMYECTVCMERNAASSTKPGPMCMNCDGLYTLSTLQKLPKIVRGLYESWSARYLLAQDEERRSDPVIRETVALIKRSIRDAQANVILCRSDKTNASSGSLLIEHDQNSYSHVTDTSAATTLVSSRRRLARPGSRVHKAHGIAKKKPSSFRANYKNSKNKYLALIDPTVLPGAWSDSGVFIYGAVPAKTATAIVTQFLREITATREPADDTGREGASSRVQIACLTPECPGYLSYPTGLCFQCTKVYCRACTQPLKLTQIANAMLIDSVHPDSSSLTRLAALAVKDHTCDPDRLATEKHLRDTTTACPNPKCGARVSKTWGCDQMWCTMPNCRTLFSYMTGKRITSGFVHNPHYTQYLRAGGERVTLGAEDIPGVNPDATTTTNTDNGHRCENDFGTTAEKVGDLYYSNTVDDLMTYLVQIRDLDLPALLAFQSRISRDNTVRYLCGFMSETAYVRLLRTHDERMVVAACLYTCILQYTDLGAQLMLDLCLEHEPEPVVVSAIDKLTRMVTQTTMSEIRKITGKTMLVTVTSKEVIVPLAGVELSKRTF
ncbi:hypothetical protein SARC_12142 [Sphaeroforma arctica JP610]|uniref:RING-type domain-containing protein n=1 Tax=Sphaeroforma arctica JP610 TaxID=667725 RepID=A0A0L0FEX5_9EUKA|nr:hypothetical protein SARC_12142 [Sphaeroforma arctica JP610]KNC75327.1 hypothetical protein SARC_12142 [Sphaeroforma arctica JP610]|eukprot:XP_014149229.1 hypothetical protein SARC_12142 [Sphaeroforma arctica JP610]